MTLQWGRFVTTNCDLLDNLDAAVCLPRGGQRVATVESMRGLTTYGRLYWTIKSEYAGIGRGGAVTTQWTRWDAQKRAKAQIIRCYATSEAQTGEERPGASADA